VAKKDLSYNWALDRDFADTLCKNMMNLWEILRSMRAQREMVWMRSYRAWSVDQLNVDNNYQGRSNLHFPQIRKEVETMTRRIMKGIFTDDYLRAVSDKFEDEDLTICNSMVVQHFLDNVMRFPTAAEPWIKQGVLYGTSPLRTYWRKEINEQFFKERYFVANKEGVFEPKTKTVQSKVTTYNAPMARAEDILQTWIYPHNIQQANEAQAVFAQTKITWQGLLERANKGMAVGITPDLKDTVDKEISEMLDQVKGEGKKSDIDFPRNLERLLQFADGGQFSAIQDNGFYNLMEIWTQVTLPDSDITVPVVMEVLNYQHPVRIQRNPFWHQQPPFDWFRYIKPPPGEFYGRGLPEPSLEMQAMADDTLNQTMDCVTLSLNPITIINPAFAPNAESFEVEPGAQWWADPNGVKNFEFPDLSDTGIKNFQIMRQAIKEMSDNAPELPDPISGKARSTGQAQLAIDEWSTDLFNFLRGIANEGLSPFAQKIHMLLQQNLNDDDIIKITGKYAGQWIDRVVKPDDILGNYSFHWITTLQIQQRTVKAQQMMNFMKVYGTLPPQVQQNIKFRWEPFLQLLLRDGFMVKDTTQIIETPRMTASTPPDIENRIIKQGSIVKVTDSDDDQAHMASHQSAMAKLSQGDAYIASLFNQHIQMHQQQIKDKQAQAAQMQQQMQMAQLQSQQMSQKKPTSGNPGAGNPRQLNESTNSSDIEKGMRG
jgi:hypothetical protein